MKNKGALKYYRSINRISLFFLKNDCKVGYKKKDRFLGINHFEINLNDHKKKNKINSFELELLILPTFRPKGEIVFLISSKKEKEEFLFNSKLFFLKNSIVFCHDSLPFFKSKMSIQCEILKLEYIFKKYHRSEKIFIEESLNMRKYHKLKNLPNLRINNWIRKTRQNFVSNGFIEFISFFFFYQTYSLFFNGFLKNFNFIRINPGPEFRFNFRF